MKKQSLRTNLTSKVQNSAVVLHKPFPLGHITADKREIRDFLKLPSATSFIRKTLYAIMEEERLVV